MPKPKPDKKSGNDAGRKQRQRDEADGCYPRSGLPISRIDRSDEYIAAWQSAYYQPSLGNPNLGDAPAMVPVDRALYERVVNAGLKPSRIASNALALACGDVVTHRLIATPTPGGGMAFSYACGAPWASVASDRAVAVLNPEDWTLVTCPDCRRGQAQITNS
jgi:hypothetical protein